MLVVPSHGLESQTEYKVNGEAVRWVPAFSTLCFLTKDDVTSH